MDYRMMKRIRRMREQTDGLRKMMCLREYVVISAAETEQRASYLCCEGQLRARNLFVSCFTDHT